MPGSLSLFGRPNEVQLGGSSSQFGFNGESGASSLVRRTAVGAAVAGGVVESFGAESEGMLSG